MTYPPTTPGFPAPQQPGGYGAPAPSYQAPAAPAGPSKLPAYLTAAVAALGLAAYLASFGPLLSINTDIGPFGGAEFTASGLSYWTVAALLAGLLAAVSLMPKSRTYTPIVAVTALLGVLLVIGQIINRPSGFSVGWALWLVLLFTLLQAGVAVAALLVENGVLSAPAPKPRFEQSYGQYGPPPGGYYGSPGGAPGAQGQPQVGAQQPGYPTPYGSYSAGGPGASAGATGGAATTGYGAHAADNTNTPPTGFSSYTPPSAPGYTPSAPAAPATEPTQGATPGADSSSPGSTPS